MKTRRTRVGVFLVAVALTAGCASPGKKTAIGAGAGAGTGAAIGGLAGGWKGAAIGAAAGAIAGGAVGNYLDKQKQELEQVAETQRMKEGLLVKLKSDLLFDTGSASLRPDAADQLAGLGAILKRYPADRIHVIGFTDSTGPKAFNQLLSEQRAETVRNALIDQGVKPEQVVSMGYGEKRPVASNKTATGRQKNRRVNLVINVATTERQPASK